MKRNFIMIIILIAVTFLLIGAASAASVNNYLPRILLRSIHILFPSAHTHVVSSRSTKMVSNTRVPRLVDSGSNKFYWGERGGIFSYTWKTYQTGTGGILVYMHYKTRTNSWFSRYSITKFSKYKLKVVETSPEISFTPVTHLKHLLLPVPCHHTVLLEKVQSPDQNRWIFLGMILVSVY